MKYVFSKYNVSIERNGDIFSFNTLTRALIKVAKGDFNVENPFLRDKGFVVKDDEDLMTYKYYYLSRIFDNKNVSLTVATTMSCNLRCPYCFEEGNKSPEFMHDDVADAIVKYLISKKAHKINITWFGGEPLMNFKEIERISSFLMNNGVMYAASIITNGTLFTKGMIEKLDEYSIKSVQITLDGKQPQHDKKRFFANGKGTYAKSSKTYHYYCNCQMCMFC